MDLAPFLTGIILGLISARAVHIVFKTLAYR
jgi:hypothetical protein